MLVNISDDFLIKTDFNSIAEVNEISQVKSMVVVGHVKLIILEVEWFYQSCKFCMKKVYRKDNTNAIVDVSNPVEDNALYKCRTRACENLLIDVVPRFKIPIRVQGASGIVSLTIFDREAKRFLKKNASDLYEDYLQGDGMCVYPEIFNTLLDRKFAFKIDITNFNIENNYKFFGVLKMTEDPHIISELEKKFQLEHGPACESLNLTSQDFKSMDTHTFKDAISCTGDNETPMSILDKSNSSGTTEFICPSKRRYTGGSLKRNLVEVYDVDEIASSSATKAYKDPSSDALKETKHHLLTPKIEK